MSLVSFPQRPFVGLLPSTYTDAIRRTPGGIFSYSDLCLILRNKSAQGTLSAAVEKLPSLLTAEDGTAATLFRPTGTDGAIEGTEKA